MKPYNTITIAAKDVRSGDYIYNSHAYCAAASWVRVAEVLTFQAGGVRLGAEVCVRTNIFDTWLHPEQGIAVRRPR